MPKVLHLKPGFEQESAYGFTICELESLVRLKQERVWSPVGSQAENHYRRLGGFVTAQYKIQSDTQEAGFEYGMTREGLAFVELLLAKRAVERELQVTEAALRVAVNQ